MRKVVCLLISVYALLGVSSCAVYSNIFLLSTDIEDRDKMLNTKRCKEVVKSYQFYTNYTDIPTSSHPANDYLYAREGGGFKFVDLYGDLFYEGCPQEGIVQNKVRAAEIFEWNAVGHSPYSQFRFGQMLFEGDGIAQNEEKGLQWLTSAAMEGSELSRDYLENIGVEPPPPLSKPTWMHLEEYWKKVGENAWREFAADMLGVVTYAAVIYAGAKSQAVTHGTVSQEPSRLIHTQRFRPAFCQISGNYTVTGTEYSAYVNGTFNTFCY